MKKNNRKICRTIYWLADTPVYSCPNCGACTYALQQRKSVLYSVVCEECGFQGPEILKTAGSSEATLEIQAIWEWNLTYIDTAP